MPHESKEEEQRRQGNETRWATIGREIADGHNRAAYMREAAILREQEQSSADRATQFAALARQIGDGINSGQDVLPLMNSLVTLRQREIRG